MYNMCKLVNKDKTNVFPTNKRNDIGDNIMQFKPSEIYTQIWNSGRLSVTP